MRHHGHDDMRALGWWWFLRGQRPAGGGDGGLVIVLLAAGLLWKWCGDPGPRGTTAVPESRVVSDAGSMVVATRAPTSDPSPSAVNGGDDVYVAADGETLGDVAEHQLGDRARWLALLSLNPTMKVDPHLQGSTPLTGGQHVRVRPGC